MEHWISLGFVRETAQLVELAKTAEALGFEGVTIADHLAMPTRFESKYPYSPEGEPFWPLDTPWPDPWVAIGAMAGATTTLKFASNIYLGALRDPFSAARAVSTAAVLSGNRVACGMASGWLKEEYDLLGIDFSTRGRRLNELIGVMRALWTGEPVSHRGEFFGFDEVILRPAPTAPIPIWTGGASPTALGRAAKRAEGWLGLVYTPEQVFEVLDKLRARLAREDRALDDFRVMLGIAGRLSSELVEHLEEAGVKGLIASPWFFSKEDTGPLATKQRLMARYASHNLSTS